MNAGLPGLEGRIQAIREVIEGAARRSGRTSREIRLVGVVKTVPADVVRAALALGLADLGENRVQEAEAKIRAVGRGAARWHMIGHLQRNKAGRAVDLFDRIQSVDNLELAALLSRRALAAGRELAVLVEVNLTGEATKYGVAPERLADLLEGVSGLPGLSLDGLMTVGRQVERAEEARPTFAGLRRLRDEAEHRVGRRLPELSMGMSGDFEVAIEEGATMVRIGTALFGSRS